MSDSPTLTKCSYCGRNMSSEFHRCPHCGKMVPRLVRCRVCEKDLKSTDSVNSYAASPDDSSKGFFHLGCLQSASECSCSVCNRTITLDELTQGSSTGSGVNCPNCGHYSFITSCTRCDGYLLTRDAVDTRQYGHDGGGVYHPSCHAIKVERLQQQYKERKRNRQCQICGGKLYFIHSLFGGTTHDRCRNEQAYDR
jgi:DNA-directed RNA polymerase subunit RPC12/RpoP